MKQKVQRVKHCDLESSIKRVVCWKKDPH